MRGGLEGEAIRFCQHRRRVFCRYAVKISPTLVYVYEGEETILNYHQPSTQGNNYPKASFADPNALEQKGAFGKFPHCPRLYNHAPVEWMKAQRSQG